MKRLHAVAVLRLSLVLLALAAAGPARALESAPVTTPHATVTLVSESDAVEPGKSVRLGLRFRLAPGWHIYWSNPGDAGEPPTLDLTLPPGAKAGGLVFPTPVRLAEGPVMTYSYLGEVLFPFTVTAPTAGGPLAVDGKASWLICARICVPEQGSLHLDLSAGQAKPSAEAPLFAAADAHMPQPSPFHAAVAPDGTLTLKGEGLSRTTVADAWFLPSAAGLIDQVAAQNPAVAEGEVRLALKPLPDFPKGAPLGGVLVLKDPGGQESALAVEAQPGPVPPPLAGAAAVAGAAPEADAGLAQLLLFAVLGGLILNLMPCVFPILAMKALALARMSGAERRHVRLHAAAYVAGVLLAFTALAVALIALRAAGSQAGWGFQFQSPIFVAVTAWLLFAIGLNLSGVFQVGGSLMGAGQGLTDHTGPLGSFFAGLLAVVVATPCTAPFMGAAVAAAVTAPAVETITIFLAMGLGLAAPYALLALVPALARRLPRPGRWMDVLKQALAFPMYGAAAWLVWVVSQQAGADGVLASVSGLVLLGFAGWALGLAQSSTGRGRHVGHGLALLSLAGVGLLLTGIGTAPAATGAASSAEGTEPYSAERLAALRAEGRPVFVNMTAAWCVTCLVNERVALSTETVRDAFAARHVAYLKGDWTRQDPGIAQFLRDHGRDGVPLYLYYAPGAETPETLPQILTESVVLDALKGAG